MCKVAHNMVLKRLVMFSENQPACLPVASEKEGGQVWGVGGDATVHGKASQVSHGELITLRTDGWLI